MNNLEQAAINSRENMERANSQAEAMQQDAVSADEAAVEAERRNGDAQERAEVSRGNCARKRSERAAAQRKFSRKPTPRNRAKLMRVSQEASETCRDAALDRDAATRAASAARNARAAARRAEGLASDANRIAFLARSVAEQAQKVFELSGDLEGAQGVIDSTQQKVNGTYMRSAYSISNNVNQSWSQMILGNLELKVSGFARKLVLGVSTTFQLGRKTEICPVGRFSYLAAYESKIILGYLRRQFLGLKKESILGAKWEELYGIRFERHVGTKHELSAAPHSEAKPSLFERGINKVANYGTRKVKSATEKNEVTNWTLDVKKQVQDIGSVVENVQTEVLKAENLIEEVDNYTINASDIYEIRASGRVTIKADGPVKMEAGSGTVELTSAHSQMKSGSDSIECDGSNVTIRGSAINWK